MTRTTVWRFSGVLALVLASGVGVAWADITGRVRHIEPTTRTITFWDGRMVQLEPGAQVWVNGQQLTFERITPGTTIVVREGARDRESGMTSQQATGSPIATHPPVNVSGKVARVDREAGIVTFEDGRIIRLTPNSDVWSLNQPGRLQPGMEVLVRDAEPLAYQWPASEFRTGQVLSVDEATRRIVLDDGTVVRLSPNTKLRVGQQVVTLSELKPGDEVVVRVQRPATGVTADGSALPREAVRATSGTARIESDEVQIIRRRYQAP